MKARDEAVSEAPAKYHIDFYERGPEGRATAVLYLLPYSPTKMHKSEFH